MTVVLSVGMVCFYSNKGLEILTNCWDIYVKISVLNLETFDGNETATECQRPKNVVTMDQVLDGLDNFALGLSVSMFASP